MALNLSKIDIGSIPSEKLYQFQSMWIAISEDNEIVTSASTYSEILQKVGNPDRVIFFKVPPLENAFAP